MCEYGFVENQDYCTVGQKCPIANGGYQEIANHAIKLDMAKEIAMIQRNEKGKQVRQYFIQVEKDYNSPEKIMARALKIAENKLNTLQIAYEEMKPKADYFDALVDKNLLTNLRDTAKELHIAPSEFNNYLLSNGYIYRDKKGKIKPYQPRVEERLFELKEYNNLYNGHVGNQTMVTPKGRETFRLLLQNN